MKFTRLLIGPLAALAMLQAHAADKLRIGVLPGVYADAISAAAKDAKAQGIDVTVTEFTDWTTPNVAVDNGDLDINFFQHQPFLDNAIQKNGYKLGSAGVSFLANIGLYSLKHQSVAQVPQGGKVGIANDPVNQGRGLLLLQKVGLIKLKPGVGFLGTINDITENPKKLRFFEIEGPQLIRALDDLDLVVVWQSYFVNSGKKAQASQALLYSGIADTFYAMGFVARSDRAQDAKLRKLVQLYQNSEAVRQTISQAFGHDPKLYTLPWQQTPKEASHGK